MMNRRTFLCGLTLETLASCGPTFRWPDVSGVRLYREWKEVM